MADDVEDDRSSPSQPDDAEDAVPYRPEVVNRMITDPAARWSDFGDDLSWYEVQAVADLEMWSRDLLGVRFSKALAFANALQILSPWMRGDQSVATALKIAPRIIVERALKHMRFGGWSDDELPPNPPEAPFR